MQLFYFQRHHTLFGSVWSSFRRHGGYAHQQKTQLNGNIGGGVGSSGDMQTRSDISNLDSDFYDSVHCSIADGINHLTKNLMQSRANHKLAMAIDSGQNFDNSMSDIKVNEELRTYSEAISMRPLMMKNGDSGGGGVSGLSPTSMLESHE